MAQEDQGLQSERQLLLERVEDALDKPMIVLGLVWLALLVLELTRGLNPALQHLVTAIWIMFILDFIVRLLIAPAKVVFLKQNWLTVLALLLPALRVFRVFRMLRIMRVARVSRSVRLVRVVTSVNRGMSSLGATLRQNRFGYVMGATMLIALSGSAGMHAFEREGGVPIFDDYWSSLWWTAMMMTTMGSEGWPLSPEGRVLCLLLAIYAFVIWGYVTATLATFFIGKKTGAYDEHTTRGPESTDHDEPGR